jgi:hypothetical protein
MNFDGRRELNPVVELQAVHTLRDGDYKVWVNVSGRFATPTIQFSSDHPEATDQGTVVALLVSGRTRQQQASDPSATTEEASQQAGNFLAGLLAGVLTLSARRELGDIIPVIIIESGDEAFRSARLRAGFQADSVIPEFLRGVVRGAYVEGFVAGSGGTTETEGSEGVAPSATGGVLLELQFPYNFVGTLRAEPNAESFGWGIDATWEP